jgi:ABC-type sugar transport system permease subunit
MYELPMYELPNSLYLKMGYASALAWILFAIILGLTLLQLWGSKKWVYYEDQAA